VWPEACGQGAFIGASASARTFPMRTSADVPDDRLYDAFDRAATTAAFDIAHEKES
jgi:hypothetical protein